MRLRLFALLVPLAAAAPLLGGCDDNSFLVDVILSNALILVHFLE